MMPYDVSASALAQSIQNGFGSVYAVNVVRSTNRLVLALLISIPLPFPPLSLCYTHYPSL